MSTPEIRGIIQSSVSGPWSVVSGNKSLPATTDATDNGLSLSLLVLGVRADHPHDALAADDLAVLTDAANACSDLHDPPANLPASLDTTCRSWPRSAESSFVA